VRNAARNCSRSAGGWKGSDVDYHDRPFKRPVRKAPTYDRKIAAQATETAGTLIAQRAAAKVARDLWVRMKAVGLDALLRELNPEPAPKADRVGTLGEAIEAARPLSTVRPISFIGFTKRFRQVAGEIAGIPRPPKANAPSGPAVEAWRAAVDAVPLDIFTKERVMAWRAARVNCSSPLHLGLPPQNPVSYQRRDFRIGGGGSRWIIPL
jgi:hypothetical protein